MRRGTEQGIALACGESLDGAGEAGVHEEVLASRLGVGAHDGMLDRLELGEGLTVPLALAELLEQGAEVPVAVVDGGEPVDQLADGLGEVLVGGLGVGPQRVPTGRRDDDGVEDGAQRRALDEGDVGMPALAVAVLFALALRVEAAGLRVVDLEHLFVVRRVRE